MTETNMNTSNPYVGERRAGTVGFPLPGVELKITDPETGETLDDGASGMIEVRGPNVFQGYWQMPEKTAAELREDGFFITGDIGMIDPDGYVHIVGRAAAGQALQLELAHVAPAPLGQRELEGLLHACGQGGQVLVHQLLLQRHGGGGDQHPRAARQRHRDRGHAVGQRLAHARAGLHHGNRALGQGIVVLQLAQLRLAEGLGHLLGHAPLALAHAKAGRGLDHRLERLQGLGGPLCGRHGRGDQARGRLCGACHCKCIRGIYLAPAAPLIL